MPADQGSDPFATFATGALESVGMVIDRYRLLQKVGEGGMGEVWLAEQKEPVSRRVALKLVKTGTNTRDVIARFESERQALALMDHRAIAKVLDAGSTPQGAPYFVMEYVAGVPITTYCDNHALSTRHRLELFVHVCEGVQHAHQKAIIHRDLKPSNILVTEIDGRAAPKIIDFGMAKAITQKLTASSSEDTNAADVSELLGQNLTKQRKGAQAEPLLRQALAFREKGDRDNWGLYRARAFLGACLAGERRYAEAEPLLLGGYNGMRQRASRMPAKERKWIGVTGEQIVGLYSQWSKPEQAAEWRSKIHEP